ncbi:hypothetical protein [Myroides profundi]|nr:hypothetical protein [Myroides profundi]AJH16347.1 hypothetical protein MPR_3225 [Myroides profundi]
MMTKEFVFTQKIQSYLRSIGRWGAFIAVCNLMLSVLLVIMFGIAYSDKMIVVFTLAILFFLQLVSVIGMLNYSIGLKSAIRNQDGEGLKYAIEGIKGYFKYLFFTLCLASLALGIGLLLVR